MIGMVIIIGIVFMAVIMPIIAMLDMESEILSKENQSRSVRIYTAIKNFMTN